MTTSAQLLNFVNLVLCFGYGLSAMCRLAKMHDRVVTRVALVYLALFVGSVVSGLQFFFFGTLAGWADVVGSGVVCAALWLTVHEWRDGPPLACLRDRAEC